MVDGLGVGDVGNIVLRDRQHLAEDGIMIVVLTLEGGSGQLLAGPDIVSRGFVYVRGSEGLMDDAKHQCLMIQCSTVWIKALQTGARSRRRSRILWVILSGSDEAPSDDYADNYGSVEDYEIEQSICQYQLFILVALLVVVGLIELGCYCYDFGYRCLPRDRCRTKLEWQGCDRIRDGGSVGA